MNPIYLIVTPFFPTPESFRGPFIYDQVKAIEQTGQYKVLVLKPKPWYSNEKDYEYEGVKVYRFSTFELPSNILPGLFNWISEWSMIHKLKSMGIELKEIEVVHAHVTGTGFLANALKRKFTGIKTVLQHHGFDVLSLTNGRLHQYKWHQKWVQDYGIRVCNQIDLHVGVSAKTLEYLNSYAEMKIKDSYVLYNGVDTTKFYPIPGLKDANYFTIGCIGNFWKLKDQITLIKAAKELIQGGKNNLRVVFIGSGELLQRCKDYVALHNLSENIDFRTEVPHQELCAFYNTLDLFVLPSWYESFGCVYAEAYACGVPFIAIEGQGISELIPKEDKNNWLIQKGDFIKLATLIENYIKKEKCQILLEDINIKTLILKFCHKIRNGKNR